MNNKKDAVIREKHPMERKIFIKPGMPACPGCQGPTVGRIVAELLEELNIEERTIGVYGISCSSNWIHGLDIDVVLLAHGRAPDVATGIKRLRPDAFVFTGQGDGDCISIGAGSLIGALTRGEKITIIMHNNTNYGTTGGQMGATSLIGQVTTTTPKGRSPATEGYPVHTAELVATFKGAAFSARGALISPKHYLLTKDYIMRAFQKQINNVGLSFVEVITACPPNWHKTPVEAVKWIEEEVLKEYPLGVFKDVDKIE